MARAWGIYARRLLDGDQPWMMQSAYRLIGPAKRYCAEASAAIRRIGPCASSG
jgi:hypothetical protein